MSEYTPTTEEVRAFVGLAHKEFDRWLAEVKAQQDKATTDRIIALFPPCPDMGDADTCTCQMYFADEIIALIKGENNG